MNTCQTCTHWVPFAVKYPKSVRPPVDEASGGYCRCERIGDDNRYLPDSLVYSYAEGGSFWTGPAFGCVHHAPEKPE